MATVPIRDILDNETGEPIFPRTHVKAVIGLADSNFFEEYVDGNGARSVKLRPDYVGLWAEGWISNGGIGAGGGGGGGGLINGVYGASSLGSIYSPTGTEDLTKTFSAFAIDKVWQSVLSLQQSTPNVSLTNGQEYSTISINGASAQFYTKSQVDGLLRGIHSFEPVPVLSLPAASEDTMFKLYLVPSADPQSQNVKDEFITVRSGSEGNYSYDWEQIGSTAIDLTGYVTTQQLGSWTGSSNITTLGTISSGSIPLSLVTGASDLKAIEALTGTSGLLKKTAANTWTLDTTSYLPNGTTLDSIADGSTRKLADYLPLSGGAITGNLAVNGTASFGSTVGVSDAISLVGTTAAKRRIYFGDSAHYIELDSNGFHFSHGVYSDGYIAVGGVGSDGGGGGVITSVYGNADLGSVYSAGGTELLSETFSAFAIDRIWQSVVALQQSTPNVSLSNGSSYSTLTVNGTVAGFYTKTQVDSLLDAINAFDYVVASSLPTASADTMYKIYLIPSADPQTGNIKDEYITIRGGSAGGYTYSWEQIGSTSIDLSGYATQTWANQQFLKKTGGDISGDIFHQIEEEDVESGEISIYEIWKITETGDATFESLSVNGVDFSTVNSRVNTLWNARNNYLLKTGGELTGDLWLHTGGANYGSKLFFGDKGSEAGYVYLHEDTDDHLVIHAESGISLTTGQSGSVTIDGTELTPGEYVTLSGLQTITGVKTFTNSLYGKTAASNTDPNWYIDNDGSASFDNLQVGGTGVVTIANAQTITGAKTFSGGITMSGANILTAVDSANQVGSVTNRFGNGFFRNLYTTYFGFRDGNNGGNQWGHIGCGDGYMSIYLEDGNGSVDGQYVFNSDYGFFHGGNGDVPCGRSDHRWSYVYGVNVDLTGDLGIAGSITPAADITSYLGSNSRRFHSGSIVNVYTRNINFKHQTTGKTDGFIAGGDGYLRFRTGADIDTAYKDIVFHETYGFYPETAGVNLGYNETNYRWATIYGVNADLSGDLALAQTSHIDIGPLRIEYDATNKALHITKADSSDTTEYGIYADGFSATGGIGTQSGSVKYVNCATQSEYNAIANKSSSTIYTIGNPVTKIYLGTIQLYTES